MAEYIEREWVLEAFGEEPQIWLDEAAEVQANDDWHVYTGIVKAAPAADVVEVVRCRDCVALYRENERFKQHCCRTGALVEDDDFCSYGERKTTD